MGWVLKWSGGVGAGPGRGLEVWLRWSAHPPGGAVSRGHVQFLLSSRLLQKWQLGFRSFCVFCLIICRKWACMQLILVPCSFFVFLMLKEMFVQVTKKVPEF